MVEMEKEIARLIVDYQAKKGKLLTIGTVESATGGRVADRITGVPGSSDYFKGSIIAYSNEAKINIVGVKRETLNTCGAVSPETALEMASGGKELLGVDICISDTGIAGPSGDTPGKPLGLFYFGIASEAGCRSEKHIFSGNREENKRDAATTSLDMLKQHLLKYPD
ncbi:MAG: CinA family protein [Dehalococcoidia bacterium]|nr:CinA family protein [Dehalococcoidia bacterium]